MSTSLLCFYFTHTKAVKFARVNLRKATQQLRIITLANQKAWRQSSINQ